MKQNSPYIIAVTGGISTGKSTAINYIRLRGYTCIDFDELTTKVYNDKILKRELINTFGKIIEKNDEIDREKLSKIVFANKTTLNSLNKIMHPKIYAEAEKEILNNYQEDILFLDIPLLFETKKDFEKFYEKVNEIWVVTSNLKVQTSRLMIRDKIDLNMAELKIKSQMNMKLKEKLADIVIYNNSDEFSLYEELRIELLNLEKRIAG